MFAFLNVIIDMLRMTRLGEFFNIWLFFTWVFFKFYLNKPFQNTVLILTFKSILMPLFSSFCNLAIVLATFLKIGRFFFQTSGHTGHAVKAMNILTLHICL
jgi:hypothetical protein